MKPFDSTVAHAFRMDWIAPMDRVNQDDYSRAVAEKAEVLLRSAQFLDLQRGTGATDLEVRVWIEAACGPACVSITFEPGAKRHGFYLLDETLRERLGCIVFEGIACVDASQSEAQGARILDEAIRALRASQRAGFGPIDWAAAMRDHEQSIRVPVLDGPRPDGRIEP